VVGPRMTASTTWDTAGNRTGASNPYLKLTIKTDGNARVMETDEQEDGTTYSHYYTYDDLDHQTSLSDLAGPLFTYTPRADGNDDSIIDANNYALTMSYSSLGEMLQRSRADGMITQYRYDNQRRRTYEGDPGAGFSYGYDSDLRLTNSTLRTGTPLSYANFDPRKMPQTINLPGGGVQTLAYDLQKRVTQRKVSYQTTASEEDYTYDALDRTRKEIYSQNGGGNNTATYVYDEAGPLLSADYKEDGADFPVANSYYSDFSRQTVTYPSGEIVNEARDTSGRLTGLSDINGNIISATSWAGTFLPKVVQLGSGMQIVYQYDARGRLTGSRVTRTSDGAVLAHMRYQYDKANNVAARQFIHREGKADVFNYDAGERLAGERIGVIPTNTTALGNAVYERQYTYHASGLDYLVSTAPTGPLVTPPPFATNWGNHDDFLLPELVDNSSRSADPMGNVALANLWVRPAGASAPQMVSATLQHDGIGRLVSVTRTDGVTVINQYQTSGLRFSRKVLQNGQLAAYSAFVYDDSGRMIEEYDRTTAQPTLIGRYYYSSGDSPVAADLWNQASEGLKRYYFIKDASQSIIAIVDSTGTVQERVWYDSFGQPVIEERDTQAPTVQSVLAAGSNSLYIVLSEPVLAPISDPGPGGGLVPVPSLSPANAITVSAGASNIVGTATLLPSVTGYPPYSVLQFTADSSQSMTGAVSITLSANSIADEWGNLNQQVLLSCQVTNGPPGTPYFAPQPAPQTAPVTVARSSVGCCFLFHGQYYDYDSGLIYLRARYYDPYSGMFFEPDPLGYEESVNHYAGMGNNPANVRDPTGLKGRKSIVVTQEGSNGRKVYNKHAIEAQGVTEEDLRNANSSAGHKLLEEGMGDHNQVALLAALRERLPNSGQHTIEIVLKYQSNKSLTRAMVNAGYPQKPEKVSKKSSNGKVDYRGERFAPDVDGLWITIDKVVLDFKETQAICDRANEINRHLSEAFARAGEAGETGYAKMWEKSSDFFKHGFTANLMEEIGMPHYNEGETRGRAWIEDELTKKVKKIPDGFGLTLRGNSDSYTIDPLRHVDREEVASVFQMKLERFHDKMNPALTGVYDKELTERVNAEQVKGAFDMTHFPIGNGAIHLQGP